MAFRLASRVAAVREALGFASYANERYSEALAEFRAARRMTGSVELWPVMADCERGLGRPERALAMAGEPEVQKLDKAGQVEMRLVAAGARRDMGQADAAVVTLQSSELASSAVHPWTARLRYAYADALLAVGREDEAREWFGKALEADQNGSTDASDRLAEMDGVEFVDALDPDADDEIAEQDVDAEDAADVELAAEAGESTAEAEAEVEEHTDTAPSTFLDNPFREPESQPAADSDDEDEDDEDGDEDGEDLDEDDEDDEDGDSDSVSASEEV